MIYKSLVILFLNEPEKFFYRLGCSDYCVHLNFNSHDISADMPSGLLQVSNVELGKLHGTSNYVLY